MRRQGSDAKETMFQDIAERIAELSQLLDRDPEQKRLYLEAIKTKVDIQLDDEWVMRDIPHEGS